MYFFKQPFRPFFTLTAITAILVPMYFVGILVNGYSINETFLTSTFWHSHEMIYGFMAALLTGFTLTAAPKWAGKPPLDYKWCILLTLLWVMARIVIIAQPSAMALYIFLPLPLVLLIVRLFVILKENQNKFIILGLLSSLLVTQVISIYAGIQLEDILLENTYKAVSFILVTFLIIFSGRLIPFFVNSRLKNDLLVQNKKFDLSIVGVALISMISSMTSLTPLTAATSIVCYILLKIRFRRLMLKEVFSIPMLWILYIGHLWINLYFILNALSLYVPTFDEGRAVFHTLYAGALGTFAIGMMSRVSLGHSGLEMKATKLIRLSFYSMIIGSVTRVIHPMVMSGLDETLLHISMGFWTLSFILYLIYFFPKFISPKEKM